MVTPDSVPVLSSNLASGILFMKALMKGSFGSRLRPEEGVIGVIDARPELSPKQIGWFGVMGERGAGSP